MERTEHFDWNDGWFFTPQFTPALLEADCSDPALTPVRLPHTVKTLPFNYCNENDYQLVSGYRRVFTAPKSWEGRTLLLTFGAAAHEAAVYCNGQRVGHHACGYTAFTVNLTGAVRLGKENVLAVRCDSRETLDIPPFGGQTETLTYGGLYRGVYLEVKENAWLRDVFIQAGTDGAFRIYSAAEGETVGCALEAEIRAPSGRRAAYVGELSLPISGTLNGVQPWSCEHPTLYTLTVRLIRPGTGGLPDRVLDQKVILFGFRTIQFVAGGLYLNGVRTELRGLVRHQSWPYQGYAMPDSLQRLDAQILKKELAARLCRDAGPALDRRPGLESPGAAELPRDGLPVPQPPQRLFVGGAGAGQRRRQRLLQKDQRGRPPAGPHPAHRRQPPRQKEPAAGRRLRLRRLFLCGGGRRGRLPAQSQRHPRPAQRLPHQRVRRDDVPRQEL